MTSFYKQQRSKPFKAILSHFLPNLTQFAPTLVSNSPQIELKVGQASLLDFNYEKTKRTQTPISRLWTQKPKPITLNYPLYLFSCLFVSFVVKKQNEPKIPFPIENRTSKIYPQGIENYKTNPKWAEHPASLSFTPARRDVLILATGSFKKRNEPKTQRRWRWKNLRKIFREWPIKSVGRALKSLFLIKKTWFLKILFIKNQ